MLEVKKKNLERSEMSNLLCKECSIHLTANFSAETMESQRQRNDVFKVLKEICQPRIVYLAKLSFINDGETKTFPDKQKLR